VEAPLKGELPVYEELFHLTKDPDETTNLADQPQYQQKLESMRAIWQRAIQKARGEGDPKVLRYTADSEAERGLSIQPE